MEVGTSGAVMETEQLAGLANQIIQTESALKEASEELVSLQASLDTINASIAALSDVVANEEADLLALENQMAQGVDNGTLTESEIADLQSQISSAELVLAQDRSQLSQLEAKHAEIQQNISDMINWIDGQQALQNERWISLEQGAFGGALSPEEIVNLERTVIVYDASIAATEQAKAMEQTLAAQEQQLADAGKQLEDAKAELNEAEALLEEKTEELEDAKAEVAEKFKDANDEIAEKQIELTDAKTELTETRIDTENKINDAQTQLDDAKQEIADLPDVNWVVLGRSENAGYNDFEAAISRTDGLASIFPTFFFLIAALVCLTTMTRMVDEQRTQIGTMKALGYGRSAIMFKYLFYAGTASLLGSALGLLAGFLFIPRVIMMAYDKLYALPDLMVTFQAGDTVVAILLAMGSTVIAAYLTSWKELKGVPAALMRPQAPKAGKRVILERIDFIWTRLSFSYKVTVRNLLRYQKRFWMTVLGVASCSALLLTGLGLRDSVATQVSDRQFGEIFRYDMSYQIKEDLTDEQRLMIDKTIEQANAVQTSLETETLTAETASGQETVTLMVPETPDEFTGFIALKDPKTKVPINLTQDGAVVTEKLAKMLDLKPGDTLTLIDVDNNQTEVMVSAIAENYLTHMVTMSPYAYRAAFGEASAPNMRMVNLPEGTTQETEQDLAVEMTSLDGVSGVHFQRESVDEFHDIIKSIDYIVWVIIVAAAALALAVLFTLTSINIAERFREIATIKVLGFYNRETGGYVFQESYILTMIGVGFGMLLGVILHGIVLDSLEVDSVMFVRQILPRSYGISAVLTLAFTGLVNKLALKKIADINMVEALKGVE